MSISPSGRISGLSALVASHDALLCDVWGVVHNGVSVFQQAVEALTAFRQAGKNVVLITNSPRPRAGVIAQLDGLGVSRDAYDAVVTSGDVTRTLISEANAPIFHLGPDRDAPLFEGLDVTLTSEEEAGVVVCTGLFDDEQETPDDYRKQLQNFAEKGLPFVCANPDIVVERGSRMIWCAGSLARLYGELGGQTRVAGKPHKPIYDLAIKTLNAIAGKDIPKSRVIACGDGMPTDVAGALNNGFDLLYVTAGIHHAEYGPADDPDEGKLAAFLKSHNAQPTAWLPRLIWDGAR